LGVTRDRVRGMFLGKAIGDALFMPLETKTPEEISLTHGRITSYIRPDGHKWFNGRDAGTWTDDTQLTLVVAESLIAQGGINLDDMALRHVESMRNEGDLGFGGSTRDAIKKLTAGLSWSESGKNDKPGRGKGNGVAMKIGPVGAYRASPVWNTLWVENRSKAIEDIVRFTLMTHYTKIAVESALAQVSAVNYCFQDSPGTFSIDTFVSCVAKMADLMNYRSSAAPEDSLPGRLLSLGKLDFDGLHAERIIGLFGGGTCYVLNSLPFSYAFFLRNPGSIEALYDVGNAGGDTDTNAAIVGELLGALNGTSIFPQHLIDGLWQRERILNTADRFCDRFRIKD